MSEQEKTVTMVVPTKVEIWVTHDLKKSFGPGICEVPESLKDHAYLKSNGARQYNEQEKQAAEAKALADQAAADQAKADAQALADQVLVDAKTVAEQALADAQTAADQLRADTEAEMAKLRQVTLAEAEVILAEASGDKARTKAAKAAVAALKG